jgi:hypothetical protein
MRPPWPPRALAIAGLALLAGCERVSGLSDLEFECLPEPLEETCAGLACGGAVDRCGEAVTCPDACPPPSACEVGGVAPNTCGCTGAPNATPEPPEGCAAVPGATGNTYYVCAQTTSWDGARDACRAFGTDLAIVRDLAENTLLRTVIPDNSFLGLSDKDCGAGACAFTWVDGTPAEFTRWASGEPNNTGGAEHCAEILAGTGLWNDIPCESQKPVLCETTCP